MTPLTGDRPYPHNRPLHVRRRLSLFVAGLGCYVLSVLSTQAPGLTERFYGASVGPFIAKALSLVTSAVPIALGEVVVVALILRQLLGGTIAVLETARGQRQVVNAVKAGALRVAQDAGVLVGLFYVLWGFNYSRATLPQRLGWPTPGEIDIEEVSELATQLVDAANAAYMEIHGVPDAGRPTQLPDDRHGLEDNLDEGWRLARSELSLPSLGGRYGRVKTPAFTGWYEWLGIAGFYFPYTGEANLRAGIPAVDHPKMLAHEKAHQRGVARESEANFWGYLSAAHAPDSYARYSAFVFAQVQLMVVLARADRELWSTLVDSRLAGVQRDIDDSRTYWRSFRGRGTRMGSRVNDAFLRTNRVEGGVQSYSRSALLFIAYARVRGGRLAPE